MIVPALQTIVMASLLAAPDADASKAPPSPAPATTIAPPTTTPASPLDRIVGPSEQPRVLVDGLKFTEGPVWVPGRIAGSVKGFLLFSDIAANTIYKLDPAQATSDSGTSKAQVWLSPSGHANGLTLDHAANILIAQHDGRVASRPATAKPDTATTILAERFEGKGFNSPNDLVVAPDGAIIFTDPPYGLRPPLGSAQRSRDIDYCGVFRRAADGTVTLLTDAIKTPNGLAFSPDGRTLYITDTSTGTVQAFDARSDGSLANQRLFATNSVKGRSGADGIRVDADGNVYAVGPGGVWVYTPEGSHLGTIPTIKSPTNLCFGGDDGKTLFITTRDSVCSIDVKIAGHGLMNTAPGQQGKLAPTAQPETPK